MKKNILLALLCPLLIFTPSFSLTADSAVRAMRMLASLLLSRNQSEQDLVDAYVWSHLAAKYDPIQAMTSARALMEEYCNDAQTKAAE